jgi:hypothetical protein
MAGITVAQTMNLVGEVADWRMRIWGSKVAVKVTIRDVRVRWWGRTEYLIRPRYGYGAIWVKARHVTITGY